jgi:hypothetical protein
MTMGITHTFQSEAEDGEDTSVVRPSDWNAAHAIPEGLDIGGDTNTQIFKMAVAICRSRRCCWHIILSDMDCRS